MQITTQLTGSRITLCLIFISFISLGLALYTVDFSIPPHSDDIGYVLTAVQYNEGDFFLSQKKHPGWSLVLTPFISILDSNNFLDYTNLARGLSLIISTISIFPMYLLLRKFFNEKYLVTNQSDRMGMRLEGPKLENIVNTNIKSEGLVKGVVQVPADGNPIILFSDHGSIGGYPKIAVVITADHDMAAQLIPGSKIKFKEVNLDEAEELFKSYFNKTENYIEQIK